MEKLNKNKKDKLFKYYTYLHLMALDIFNGERTISELLIKDLMKNTPSELADFTKGLVELLTKGQYSKNLKMEQRLSTYLFALWLLINKRHLDAFKSFNLFMYHPEWIDSDLKFILEAIFFYTLKNNVLYAIAEGKLK